MRGSYAGAPSVQQAGKTAFPQNDDRNQKQAEPEVPECRQPAQKLFQQQEDQCPDNGAADRSQTANNDDEEISSAEFVQLMDFRCNEAGEIRVEKTRQPQTAPAAT